VGTEWKVFNTSYAMYLAVLASMVHGLTVPGAMEAAQREKGFTKGLFEWLRKAPWGNPVFSGVFMSLIGFGFLGGISGVMMGTEQLNMIIHNTIYVPGHFHATVVLGTTLAFMAITYFLLPTLFQREIILPGWAKWQPYVFGIGMAVFTLTMMGAGTLGVPRRHWDITFAGASLPYEFPGTALLMMTLVGISGVIAIIGGAMYIIITVGTVLFGKRLDAGAYTTQVSPLRLPVAAALRGHGVVGGGFHAPGTFSLALVFLVAFVLYYFVNWKYLSTVWGLS
jgi:cytochrome c oxidase subunit 1